MQGIKRKIVYITAYELIGMMVSALGLALLSGQAPSNTGALAIIITTIAVSWNLIYNGLFEYWESRQVSRVRTLKRRILHAIGFQLTLIIYLIPLIAWWLSITLYHALMLDIALIIAIPCYTFLYNWAFDKLCGLPTSALSPSNKPT